MRGYVGEKRELLPHVKKRGPAGAGPLSDRWRLELYAILVSMIVTRRFFVFLIFLEMFALIAPFFLIALRRVTFSFSLGGFVG